jgi:hypothetical protein
MTTVDGGETFGGIVSRTKNLSWGAPDPDRAIGSEATRRYLEVAVSEANLRSSPCKTSEAESYCEWTSRRSESRAARSDALGRNIH